jgi:hypothetical protein
MCDALLRRVPAAHDRECRPIEKLEPAFRVKERRRIGSIEERLRIVGVSEGEHVIRRVFEPLRDAREELGWNRRRHCARGAVGDGGGDLSAWCSEDLLRSAERYEKLPVRLVGQAGSEAQAQPGGEVRV